MAVTPAPSCCHAGFFSGVSSLGLSHVVSLTYENLLPGLLRGTTSGFLSTPEALLLTAGTGEGEEGRVVVVVLAQDDASADGMLTFSPALSTGAFVAVSALDGVSKDGVLTLPPALSTGDKGRIAILALGGESADSMLTVSSALSIGGFGDDGLVAVLARDGVSGDSTLTVSSALSAGGSGDDGLIADLAHNVSADVTLTASDGMLTTPPPALSP